MNNETLVNDLKFSINQLKGLRNEAITKHFLARRVETYRHLITRLERVLKWVETDELPENPHFKVGWEIDVWEKDSTSAARKARELVCSPDTLATVFHVTNVETGDTMPVDLLEKK